MVPQTRTCLDGAGNTIKTGDWVAPFYGKGKPFQVVVDEAMCIVIGYPSIRSGTSDNRLTHKSMATSAFYKVDPPSHDPHQRSTC